MPRAPTDLISAHSYYTNTTYDPCGAPSLLIRFDLYIYLHTFIPTAYNLLHSMTILSVAHISRLVVSEATREMPGSLLITITQFKRTY